MQMTNVQRAKEAKKLIRKGKEAQKRVDRKKDEKMKEGHVVEDKWHKKEKIARTGR